jgi:hypothetical protein
MPEVGFCQIFADMYKTPKNGRKRDLLKVRRGWMYSSIHSYSNNKDVTKVS